MNQPPSQPKKGMRYHLIFSVMALFLLWIPFVLAERYYVLGLSNTQGQFIINSFSVEEIETEIALPNGAEYTLSVLSLNGQILYSSNFNLSGSYPLLLSIPYREAGWSIIISNASGELLSIPVGNYAKVCGDGVCQAHENSASCPKDCKDIGNVLPEDEKMPISSVGQKADANFSNGKRPVANIKIPKPAQKQEKKNGGGGKGYTIYLGLFLAGLISVGGLFARNIMQGRKEKLGRIRKYINYNMKRGYPFEQVAGTLMRRGISEGEIQEAMGRV